MAPLKIEKLAALLVLTAGGLVTATADGGWVAYNDCLREPGDATAANVTGWTIHSRDLDHFTGPLKDFETGSDTGMPAVTFSMGGAGLQVSSGGAGGNPALGTDAYEIFGNIIDFGPNTVYYGSVGWWVEIEFTGLDPAKTYTFVGTAIRSNNYPGRVSLFTISGAVSYVNNSSDGVLEKTEDTTKLLAGDNSITGYVVRWDEIVPAPDGSFKVRAEATADSDGGRAYPFGGFMLEEIGKAGNRPPEVNVGTYDSLTWPRSTLQLDADVHDDDPCGYGILTVKWSQLDGPGPVRFLPTDDIEDPCAIFSAPGTYELLLQAWDEVPQEGNDVATITIIEPDCPVGDIGGDCIVDFKDLVLLSGQWLSSPDCSGFGCPDLDGSALVDIRDYGFLAQNWLRSWVGSVRVTIGPQGAVDAGAQWQLDGGPWRDSGYTETMLPVGLHTVDFRPVKDWTKPSSRTAQVQMNQTTTITAAYAKMPDSPLIISEFMAINSYVPRINPLNLYTRVEGENEHPDWIEIHNISTQTMALDGWYVTDDANDLTKWQFPSGRSIGVGGYLVVYASHKDSVRFPADYPYVDDSGNLHTNFELDGDGGYLALVQPDGLTVAHEYTTYPEQRGLISYGLAPSGQVGYFRSPTRGTQNSDIYAGVVADTKFSVDRGFYDEPFEVEITCATEGAVIRYTTDGSEPTLANGSDFDPGMPIAITTTTSLRAAAFKPDWLQTNTDTHTYVFLDDVLAQATNPTTGAQVAPEGCPTSWGSATGDYQVDPDVVGQDGKDIFGGVYAATIRDDLKSIPTLSLAMDRSDWFGSQGIYVNQSQDGSERAVSAELIDPNGREEFQINCGVQMQGGVSGGGTSLDRWKSYKLSMRLVFKGGYGPSKLRFALFGEDAADSFDTIVLDARLNNVWIHPSSGQQIRGQYTRDQYPCDIQNAMGGFAPHGRPVHLYLSGLYWGLYWVHERPDETFAESYFGGRKEDYDVLKHNHSLVINGSDDNYDEMFTVPGSDFDQMQEYLDAPNLCDYMIMNFYVGNTDWSHKNWYASRNKRDPAGRWRYHCWDAEHCLESLGENVTGKNQSSSPTGLHQRLTTSQEYRMLFADRAHRHFFNDGALTPEYAKALYENLLRQIDRAVVGESARWGDNRRSRPYTRDVEWAAERDWLLNEYFPRRSSTVLGQIRSQGWYPNIDAPVFYINGSYQHGGHISIGDSLTMAAAGAIWYTLDGTDPRLPGGAVNTSHATVYSGALSFTESTHVKARLRNRTDWSALNEATFAVGPIVENLRITEIMYHPQDTNNPDDSNTEFIELKNIGTETINIHLVKFTNGVDFTFPSIELVPDEYVLVVKDMEAFVAKYGPGFNIAGQYAGSLNNNGERVELQDAAGTTIHSFRYRDGWYDITDGDGFSLTVKDPTNTDPDRWGDKATWRPSANVDGSPGTDDAGQIPELGDVVINELLAHSHAEAFDWIELHNTTDHTINIGGWFLSDDGDNLNKYEIAEGRTITAGGYVVFTEDLHFGNWSDPGANVPFALSENGETLYLHSGRDGELTGYSEQETFGPSETGIAFGRYQKSTGSYNFVAMSVNTPGSANAYPKIGPIVITEIMYHPDSPADAEYVELLNISDSEVPLYDFITDEPWRFTDDPDDPGIEFLFPSDPPVSVASGEHILMVKDLATFSSKYTVPGGVQIFAWGAGRLDNGGEKVQISMPGDVDAAGIRQYIRVDRVVYSDGSHPDDFASGVDPWPTGADGLGSSLSRLFPQNYGNDPNNWQATVPSPGTAGPE